MRYYEDPIARLARLAATICFVAISIVSAIRGDFAMFLVSLLFLWTMFDDSGWYAVDEDECICDPGLVCRGCPVCDA